MKINITAITDIGCARDNNEDAYVFCPDLTHPDWRLNRTNGYIPLGTLGALLVVADGMGGPNAGEIASSVAIDSISHSFTTNAASEAASSEEKALELLTKAIKDADEAINKRMYDSPDTAGMGTTIVVCWLMAEKAYVAWCGDSRCYVYNSTDGLRPLTKDHSYVQELVDKGELSEEEAFTHPDNNVITRGLGDFDTLVKPDIISTPVKAGDMFMLCSDGLCGYCTNEQISKVMAECPFDTEKCADKLMETALAMPGDDNICITVASVLSDDDEKATPPPSKFFQLLKKFFN